MLGLVSRRIFDDAMQGKPEKEKKARAKKKDAAATAQPAQGTTGAEASTAAAV